MTDRPQRYFTRRRVVQSLACAAAVLGAVAAVFLPLYEVTTQHGSGSEVTSRASALEVMGPSVIAVVLPPVVFAALPLIARGRWWSRLTFVSASLLILFTLVTLTSIGLLFLPATAAAVVGVFVDRPRRQESTAFAKLLNSKQS